MFGNGFRFTFKKYFIMSYWISYFEEQVRFNFFEYFLLLFLIINVYLYFACIISCDAGSITTNYTFKIRF